MTDHTEEFRAALAKLRLFVVHFVEEFNLDGEGSAIEVSAVSADGSRPLLRLSLADCFTEVDRLLADESTGNFVLVPREPTSTMLEAVAPFPVHLVAEHPDPADPWHKAMRVATLVEQALLASHYRQLIEAWLAETPEEDNDG